MKYLVFVGAAAQIWGIYIYIKDMFRGQTRPNLVSWVLWTVSPMIITSGALAKGVRWSVLPAFLAGLGPLIVVVSALVRKQARWRLQKFDYLCGASSLLALVVWSYTREANYAVALAIVGDFLAGLPTIIKSYQHPQTESVMTYKLGIFSACCSIFAIEKWIFAAYILPIYFISMNLSLVLAEMLGRKKLKA